MVGIDGLIAGSNQRKRCRSVTAAALHLLKVERPTKTAGARLDARVPGSRSAGMTSPALVASCGVDGRGVGR